MAKQANFKDFKRQYLREVERQKRKLVNQKKAMALFAVDQVVERTPVRTGGMRTAWAVTFGGASQNIYRKGDEGESIESLRATVESITYETGSVHIANRHFAFRWIEEGGFVPPDPGPSRDRFIDVLGRKRFGGMWVEGGWSTQAPEGVIAPTVEKMRRRFRRYVPQVN